LPLCEDLRCKPAIATLPGATLRPGTDEDADAIHALILAHQVEGHLLPRSVADVRRHATRFTVAEEDGVIVGCAELVPLSFRVAEIRSLVVAEGVRGAGVASRLVAAIRLRSETAGFDTLTAFTHDARFFVRQNFSIVPHVWVPEKIARDCAACPLFRQCEQHAMVLPLHKVVPYGAVVQRPVAVA
jgi:amino-acid N-acetyltransferase